MKTKNVFLKLFTTVLTIFMLFSNVVFAEGLKQETDGMYFYNANEQKVYDNWVKYNGKWYRTDAKGKLLVGFFNDKTDGKTYFLNTNDGADYGSMVSNGIHTIDGFYYMFDNDGSIKKSTTNLLVDIGQGFSINNEGKIFAFNNLMQDVSTNRSEFYSNEVYAKDLTFNNLKFFQLLTTPQMNQTQVLTPGLVQDLKVVVVEME